MKQLQHRPRRARLLRAPFAALTVTLLALGLLGPTPASAAFEQVGCFAGTFPGLTDSCKPVLPAPKSESEFGEEVQLGGVGGMAVNYTGNGGVPAGTVYAATNGAGGEAVRVAMYTPKVNPVTSEIELQFKLSWRVTELGGAFKRCGPGLPEKCEPRVKAGPGHVDVDIDQATGNVYVLDGEIIEAGKKMVVVYGSEGYGPDGKTEITRFGEQAPVGSEPPKTSETPEKIHKSNLPGGLAVNEAGEVYVFDVNYFDGPFYRLMKFRPKVPGVFTEYEYAGLSEDVGSGAVGVGGNKEPALPVADAAGNIYVAPGQNRIEMYDPSNPGDPPVCSFEFTQGGITSITVNPQTGEVFLFSYKPPKRVRRLGPCNPATGKFAESEPEPEAFALAPERDELWAMAFDPVRQIDPDRALGVLYGGAGAPVSSQGIGKGEDGQSSLGYVFAPVKEVDPEVEAQSVSHVTATGAVLQATIDPNGFDTHYAFQYLSAAEYEANPPGERFAGAKEAPPGGGTVKGGEGAQNVSTAIGGLDPDTEYRFRAVAVSECASGKACEAQGEAEAFRVFPLIPPGLPDKRAYELVSPAQKQGGQVLPADSSVSSCGFECKPGGSYPHFPMQSAPDGDSVVYEGTPFFSGVGAAIENEYLSHRDPKAGWQTVDLSPALQGKAGGYRAFDPDLTLGVLEQGISTLSSKAPAGYPNLYAQPTDELLGLQPLLTEAPPNRTSGGSLEFKIKYAGASADLSRVFFAANDALTEATAFAPAAPEGAPTQFNLYEWERATGQLRLVNVKPDETSEAGAAFAPGSANVVSADGSKVFWSDEAGQLYVREDAEATRAIPGKFLSASADGAKVLLDDGCLYDLQAEACTDLTLDQSEAHKGGFKGIAGQSEDLSRVYFVDTEVLTGEEANSEGDKAQVGEPNVYAWSEEGPTRYVATLDAKDNDGVGATRTKTWASLPSQRTAEASPAGRFLAFQSRAPLTGFDSTGPCESNSGIVTQSPCSEVFLYDPASGELACPSCNPTGGAAQGWSLLRLINGGFPDTLPQPRYLTDEGRLYFDSRDSLSLADVNDGVEDVYQFEPNGIGTCEREAGCVSLISAGTGSVDSNFLAIDATGKNVFFTTRDRLVLKDKDELFDLYDAREEGGIASETETQRPECQGEACQPAPALPPEQKRTFKGSGNFKPPSKTKPRCPKGKRRVQSRGRVRCAKRGRKQSHQRRAKAKKGGHR